MPTIKLPKKKPREVTYNKQAYQWIYNTPIWKRLRAEKFKANPVCEHCEKEGRVSITEEVHHRIPFEIMSSREQQQEVAYDRDNLVSLCMDCHKEAHRLLRGGKPNFIPPHAQYR